MSLIDMIFDGGFASACATVVSNPFDVLRTRMQLQGEMRQKGDYEVLYRGLFQGMYKIARDEGVMSLQKGLLPAVMWQVTQNGIRIGLYPEVKADMGRALDFLERRAHTLTSWRRADDGQTGPSHEAAAPAPASARYAFFVCLVSSSLCGIAGAVVSSPFILVKTRLQSQHTRPCRSASQPAARALSEASTGTQFRYTGFFDALRHVYRQGGLFGMWQGAGVAAQRNMVAAAAQLTSYDYGRLFIARGTGLPVSDWRVHVLAGLFSSLCIVVCTNPLAVVMTRAYNTRLGPDGRRMASLNVFRQTVVVFRVEGLSGLYKGWEAMLGRSVPHNIATFVVLEWLRKMRETHFSSRAYTSGSSVKAESVGRAKSGG